MELYREIILDHYRDPRNRGHVQRADQSGSVVNRSCGDSLTVELQLDRDGRVDVLACESRESKLLWYHQRPDRGFDETVIASDLRAPVQAAAVDIDGDGDLDVLVASMGVVFPNNDRIGSVIVLENDGRMHFTPHFLLENTARVTDVRAGDFNGDGRLDLAVAQFGYDQGEIRWMERTGPWEFTSHNLLNLSGTINVCVADLTGDHRPDIAALVSQQWEEVHLFINQGYGQFSDKVIFGSTNEDFASSNIRLCDLNRDGRPDISRDDDGRELVRILRDRLRGGACACRSRHPAVAQVVDRQRQRIGGQQVELGAGGGAGGGRQGAERDQVVVGRIEPVRGHPFERGVQLRECFPGPEGREAGPLVDLGDDGGAREDLSAGLEAPHAPQEIDPLPDLPGRLLGERGRRRGGEGEAGEQDQDGGVAHGRTLPLSRPPGIGEAPRPGVAKGLKEMWWAGSADGRVWRGGRGDPGAVRAWRGPGTRRSTAVRSSRGFQGGAAYVLAVPGCATVSRNAPPPSELTRWRTPGPAANTSPGRRS